MRRRLGFPVAAFLIWSGLIWSGLIWLGTGGATEAPGGGAPACPPQCADLPSALASLLKIGTGQAGGKLGFRVRGFEDQGNPPGLPAHTAWAGDRLRLTWADLPRGATAAGRVIVAGEEVARGVGAAELRLPAPGDTGWRLQLDDGRSFAGVVRRLGEPEVAAVKADLARAGSAASDRTRTAALQLDAYVAHELYLSALRYLDARPELAAEEPFRSLHAVILERMAQAPPPP